MRVNFDWCFAKWFSNLTANTVRCRLNGYHGFIQQSYCQYSKLVLNASMSILIDALSPHQTQHFFLLCSSHLCLLFSSNLVWWFGGFSTPVHHRKWYPTGLILSQVFLKSCFGSLFLHSLWKEKSNYFIFLH